MRTLPEFGKGSSADDQGYDLSFLIGWLEDMVESEAEICECNAPLKDRRARLEQAEAALNALYEVSDWSSLLTRAYRSKQNRDKP